MRCTAVNLDSNVQCGLPAGHGGNHQNGTTVKPWPDEAKLSPIMAGAIAGIKAGLEAQPVSPVPVCTDHYDCRDCSKHEDYAVAVERERCARIVEQYEGGWSGAEDGKPWNCLEIIAAKIREGK